MIKLRIRPSMQFCLLPPMFLYVNNSSISIIDYNIFTNVRKTIGAHGVFGVSGAILGSLK